MSFSRGELVLVSLVFTDGAAAKRRPVTVIFDSGDQDLLVAPVTGHTARSVQDIPLTQWQKAGLRLPSIVRLEQLATIEKSAVLHRLGQIEPSDWANIKPALSQFFSDIMAG